MGNEAATEAAARGRFRLGRTIFALVVFVLLGLGAKAWHDTMADPVVRRATIVRPGLPLNSSPVRIALLSDIHVAGPDMPPSRLGRIVAQVNALRPDLVLIAGDFVSDKRTATRLYRTRNRSLPWPSCSPALPP